MSNGLNQPTSARNLEKTLKNITPCAPTDFPKNDWEPNSVSLVGHDTAALNPGQNIRRLLSACECAVDVWITVLT